MKKPGVLTNAVSNPQDLSIGSEPIGGGGGGDEDDGQGRDSRSAHNKTPQKNASTFLPGTKSSIILINILIVESIEYLFSFFYSSTKST